MEKIKVLIADDHRVVREGLAAILRRKTTFILSARLRMVWKQSRR